MIKNPAQPTTNNSSAFAYFAGGCFWCTEGIFKRLKGVIAVTPGFAGGTTDHPTYEEVCAGNTGHAEVIRIEYQPRQISYETLLKVFFATHDPTTVDQQGHDYGSQYRSLILTTSPGEAAAAHEMIESLNQQQAYGKPIVTEVKPLTQFYPAEAYHHDYFDKHQTEPYCQIVIFPKIAHLKKEFARLLK